jgi:hypothetical protein
MFPHKVCWLHLWTLRFLCVQSHLEGPIEQVFTISLMNDNSLCLDLYGQNTDNGTPIDFWTCASNLKGQQWIFNPGSYALISNVNRQAGSDKCVDAGNRQKGTKLMLWDCNDQPQQKWAFVPYGIKSWGYIQLSSTNTLYLNPVTCSSGSSAIASEGTSALCPQQGGGGGGNEIFNLILVKAQSNATDSSSSIHV